MPAKPGAIAAERLAIASEREDIANERRDHQQEKENMREKIKQQEARISQQSNMNLCILVALAVATGCFMGALLFSVSLVYLSPSRSSYDQFSAAQQTLTERVTVAVNSATGTPYLGSVKPGFSLSTTEMDAKPFCHLHDRWLQEFPQGTPGCPHSSENPTCSLYEWLGLDLVNYPFSSASQTSSSLMFSGANSGDETTIDPCAFDRLVELHIELENNVPHAHTDNEKRLALLKSPIINIIFNSVRSRGRETAEDAARAALVVDTIESLMLDVTNAILYDEMFMPKLGWEFVGKEPRPGVRTGSTARTSEGERRVKSMWENENKGFWTRSKSVVGLQELCS